MTKSLFIKLAKDSVVLLECVFVCMPVQKETEKRSAPWREMGAGT